MGAITLKSKTYTESTDVDVAGISVKATVHYPREIFLYMAQATEAESSQGTHQ